MADTSPRQGHSSWADWSADVNKQIRAINQRLKLLDDLLFGDLSKISAECTTPRIITLIENVCREVLTDRRVMRDVGTWSAERDYQPGDFTTDHGAGWIARVASKGLRPGADNAGWRLAVKSDTSQLSKIVRGAVQAELRKQGKGSVR